MYAMKYFVKITFATILLLTHHISFGQSVGYLGKKVSINYDFYSYSALNNPNANGNKGILALNARHYFSLDWVVGKSQSIGVGVHYTKSSFDFERTLYADVSGDGSGTNMDLSYKGTIGQLSCLGFDLHTHLYMNSNLAPLGLYFKPEILLLSINASFDSVQANKNLVNNMGPINNYPILKNDGPYLTAGLGLTIGNHIVFFKRLIFDIGFQLGFVYADGLMSSIKSKVNESSIGTGVTSNNYIKCLVENRMTSQYFFNFKAGIGFLVF